MVQRNTIIYTSDMTDFQMDQQNQRYPRPEPCMLLGVIPNPPQANIHSLVATPGNMANLALHQIPRHFDGAFYGTVQYTSIPHHPATAASHNIGVVAASNFYNVPMATSSCAVAPIPQNCRSSDQLPSSSSYGFNGHMVDEHGRNVKFAEHVRDSYKIKTAEGISGSNQYLNASTGASIVAPLNQVHPDGFTRMDASYFAPHQYRGNDTPIVEARGSHENVRSGSVALGMNAPWAHNHDHLIHGNYISQSFPPSSTHWSDQPSSSNRGDGGASAWNQVPAVPYMHGGSFNRGSFEVANVGLQGYHETASSMGSLHPSPINQGFHGLHHPPLPLQGMRGHEFTFHPPVPTNSYRLLPNNASNGVLIPQNNLAVGPTYPPSGLGMYRPQRGDAIQGTAPCSNPQRRLLPADDAAMLDNQGYYEVGDNVDHHRELRLDIEDMSYEDLLALGERIGSVNTGLSEEMIARQLKTRTYLSTPASLNMEEVACVPLEADSCIICQENYKNQEKIGTLDCGHEYHGGCIKKWLLVKNVCPICKSEALHHAGKRHA